MSTGTEQILMYSVESVYGQCSSSPENLLGIVTGGSLNEATRVYPFSGPESRWVVWSTYGGVSCGGKCNLVLCDLETLAWAIARPGSRSPLISCSIDAGYAGGLLTKRMVGCKCSELSLNFRVDGSPLIADLSWIGQQVLGTDDLGETSLPSGLIWTAEGATLYMDSVPVQRLREVSVKVNNNLKPKYLVNRNWSGGLGSNPRVLSWINEGPQEVSVQVKACDHSLPIPPRGFTWQSPVQIVLELYNPYSEVTRYVNLLGCYPKVHEEPFTPLREVVLSNEYTVSTVTIT